jgi:hypothetical protein
LKKFLNTRRRSASSSAVVYPDKAEIMVRDGEKRMFTAGDFFLLEDNKGNGHRTE